MRATAAARYLFCLASATLLVACAPAPPGQDGEVAGASPVIATPIVAPSPPAASGTPSPIEVQAFQQQIVDVHRDMLWVLQHMAAMDPERQQRVGAMMTDLMAAETPLLASMQPLVEQMTPEERQASATNVRRIRDNLRDMRLLALGEPKSDGYLSGTEGNGAPAAGADAPGMGEMGQQMDDLNSQMLTHLQQMSIPQIQGIAANMVDLTGNLDRLKVPIGSAFGRVSPQQREVLRRQMDAMRTITMQMVQVAGGN